MYDEVVTMDYNKIIEMDNVTVDDCVNVYRHRGLRAVINDGHVVNFIDEGLEETRSAYYNRKRR